MLALAENRPARTAPSGCSGTLPQKRHRDWIGNLLRMDQPEDTNAAIWQSSDIAQTWAAEAAARERNHGAQWRLMADLLPFSEHDAFTFLDLGAGTGNLSRAILERHPRSTAVLADFSEQMMSAAEGEMKPFAGRYSCIKFDMSRREWPADIPAQLDAIVASLCIHHLPDERKQGLFREIFEHLVPGGWSVNYDPVRPEDPVVRSVWQRVGDRYDPEMARKRLHPTPEERARHENHLRHMIPLTRQLGYLQAAGFEGIDVYWKQLEWVVYAGCRPADVAA
jgi:tRNA (cmo5U34)-methyltransferase